MDREEEFARQVELRLLQQSRQHWTEFSSIIAGANGLLMAVLIGRIALLGAPTRVTWAATLIAVASAASMLLAYLSIQLGSVTSFGAAGAFVVGSSFALATGQFGLLLVPVSVLDPLCEQRRRDSPCLVPKTAPQICGIGCSPSRCSPSARR